MESNHAPLSYQESVLTDELDAQTLYFTRDVSLKTIIRIKSSLPILQGSGVLQALLFLPK